jgi:hypothetical protein
VNSSGKRNPLRRGPRCPPKNDKDFGFTLADIRTPGVAGGTSSVTF